MRHSPRLRKPETSSGLALNQGFQRAHARTLSPIKVVLDASLAFHLRSLLKYESRDVAHFVSHLATSGDRIAYEPWRSPLPLADLQKLPGDLYEAFFSKDMEVCGEQFRGFAALSPRDVRAPVRCSVVYEGLYGESYDIICYSIN